jgi:hypothetical protein
MPASSRYIRARVVGPVEFAGDADAVVSGPRKKLTRKQKTIRRLLRKARALKKHIAHLRIRKPLGWKGAVRNAKTNLRVVMSDLKMAGWRPRKPSRALKPGEDEMDAALEDIPEPEPGESDDDPELDAPDEPEDAAEGNWLDGYVGAEPAKKPKKNLWQEAGKLLAAKWSPPVPLAGGARIQTRPGQRAMVATVSPGLFIVQLVSDDAAKKLAGDNVGVLPLLLYPLVKNQVQKALAPKPAAPAAQPAAQPAAAPAQPAAAGDLGCDCQKRS